MSARAGLLSLKPENAEAGSRSQERLSPTTVLLTHAVRSIYLCGKSCEATRPLEKRSVNEELNESVDSRAEQSEEKIPRFEAECGGHCC